MSVRVGVLGAAGRMGAEACRAIEAADDLELVARIDVDDALEELVEAGAQVAVHLSSPDAVSAPTRPATADSRMKGPWM